MKLLTLDILGGTAGGVEDGSLPLHLEETVVNNVVSQEKASSREHRVMEGSLTLDNVARPALKREEIEMMGAIYLHLRHNGR